MEENNHNFELNNAEQIEEETPLTKEEILERSRKENQNGDERNRKLLNYGCYVTFCIGLLSLFVISFVNLFYLNKQSYELLVVIFIMGSVTFLWQGIFGKKVRVASIIVGICSMILAIIYLVLWIQTLTV